MTPYVEATSAVAVCQHYVLQHHGEYLSVEVLGRLVAMSPRHFARVFARDAKVTPAEFVARARVDAARIKLENSAMPLKTVAFECGFGNAAQMRAAFMRYVGVSARQYRENFYLAAAEPAE